MIASFFFNIIFVVVVIGLGLASFLLGKKTWARARVGGCARRYALDEHLVTSERFRGAKTRGTRTALCNVISPPHTHTVMRTRPFPRARAHFPQRPVYYMCAHTYSTYKYG